MASSQQREVDFSNYFKNQPKNNKSGNGQKPTRSNASNTRLIVMVLIMLVLAGSLGFLLYSNSRSNVAAIPEGYHLVGSPARLEKIK